MVRQNVYQFRYCKVLEEEEENEQNESVPDYLLECSGAAAKERQTMKVAECCMRIRADDAGQI